MSLVVGGISLLVAALGVAKLVLPTVEAWSAGKELFFGAAVVAVIAGSFVLARWLTRGTAAARHA
jgi:high-affinity nickel-transport protein